MFKETNINTLATCPPGAASSVNQGEGYRLVLNNPVIDDDFRSHAALGKKKPPDLCPCSWHACSLFNSPDKLVSVKGLPRFKGGWVAVVKVSLNNASGPVLENSKTGHMDWWRFAAFNTVANSTTVMVF